MNVKLILSLFVFIMSAVVANAADPVGYAQIRICPGGCDELTGTDPTDYVFNPSETGSACIAQSSYIEGESKIYSLYCPGGIEQYEDATAVMQNIVGVPVGMETDQARQAFNTWSMGVNPPDCSPAHINGGIGEGYIYSTFANTDPALSNVNLTMWKRRHCESTAGGSLTPIGTIGGGSGGGSTDMTATNSLLTEIRDNTAGGGSGGTPVDLTPVTSGLSNVQGQVSDVGTKIDGLSSKLDGVYTGGDGSGQTPATIDKTTKETEFLDNAETEFTGFQTSVKGTALYNSIGTFFNGVPSGGSSVFSVNAGQFGNHSIDLADYSNVWNVIKALILIGCSYVAIKIIFLGRS